MGVYHSRVTPARAAPPELIGGVSAILRYTDRARELAIAHGDDRLAALLDAIAARAARMRAYIDEAAALGWPGGEV